MPDSNDRRLDDAAEPRSSTRAAGDPGQVDFAADHPLSAGTRIGEFEIIRLLGRGASAQVYLAHQTSLDRQVALKVSATDSREARTMARLEHDNIVPVYGDQIADGRSLLVMRYIQGVTLAQLIERLAEREAPPTTGQDILDVLDDESTDPTTAASDDRGLMAKRTFVEAICQLILGLARALAHAHKNGTLHCDVKPANALLAGSGRAMLMDFNVSIETGGRTCVRGGTLAYMSPEHLAVYTPVTGAVQVPFDERSDVYGLGVVMYELLTGRHPFATRAVDSTAPAALNQMLAERLAGVRQLDLPGASAGVCAIVARCLEPTVEKRYQSAEELADDLKRLLSNRQLYHADDTNLRERALKWTRRHPRLSTAGLSAIVATLAAGVVAIAVDLSRLQKIDRLHAQAETALAEGRSHDAVGAIEQAERSLAADDLILGRVGASRRRRQARELSTQLSRTAASLEYERFRRLTDRARIQDDLQRVARTSEDPLEVYGVLKRNDWYRRPVFTTLELSRRTRVAEDITELLMISAVGHQTSGGSRQDADNLDEAFLLLRRVAPEHDRAMAVVATRRSLAADTEDNGITIAKPTEFDHYLLGMAAAKRGDHEVAVERFKQCLEVCRRLDRPPRFWAQFMLAFCLEQTGRIDEAIAGYGIAIGIRDDFAWSYHNLGLIHAGRGDDEQAATRFREAISHDAELAPAFANLGVLQYRTGDFSDAIASLNRAIILGYETSEAFANRAAVKEALGDREGARRDLEVALELDKDNSVASEGLRRLAPVH